MASTNKIKQIEMEFNKLVKTYILPFLQKVGFELTGESLVNVMNFSSSEILVNIAFNEIEKSNFIEIGKKGDVLYPFSDVAVRNILDSELLLDQVPPMEFVTNFISIFEQKKGVELLSGDLNSFIMFSLDRISDFNVQLIQQTLAAAWLIKDYKSYIYQFEQIDATKVSQSFLLKYHLAKKNMQNR